MPSPDITPIPLAAGERPPVPGAVKISSKESGAKHRSARTKARKVALDALYQADMRDADPRDILDERGDQGLSTFAFAKRIVTGVRAYQREIDQRISECATGDWTIERMPSVDRNLARIAIWELDYSDIDSTAAIAEALELADELSTDESMAFLNGLLGRAAKSRPER